MSRLTKKYNQTRRKFRKDLFQEASKNKALAMLIIETYAAWHHKRHITKIWSMFKNPNYCEFREDYSENLMGKHLTGRHDVWRSLYFANRELHDKYRGKIPETFAMGDALGVAYRVLKS